MTSFMLSTRRQISQTFLRVFFTLTARITVIGIENLPTGPAILAANHLHNADAPVLVSFLRPLPEVIGLFERRKKWVDPFVHFYKVIPVRRDEIDRSVLQTALTVLAEGKQLLLFPEASISYGGVLKEARDGVGYLALKAQVPVVPIALAGTEDTFTAWRRGHRPEISVTIGKPLTFLPDASLSRRAQRKQATQTVMRSLATLLPERYRGHYQPLVLTPF